MRLVDADEIRKKAVPHTRGEHGYSANIRKWAVLVGDIDDAPTIEAEPVRHGRWIDGADSFGAERGKFRVCSWCNTCFPRDDAIVPPAYWQGCPNCGAKMDGGAE